MQGLGVALALSGDDAAAVLGWLLVSLGSIVALIGTIGWGILVGFRARDRDTRTG